MKIAMIASNWRDISSDTNNIYAPGIIILSLVDLLVERGHDVTLFAPKNTKTKAKLISEGLNSSYHDFRSLWDKDQEVYLQIQLQYEMVLLSKAFEMANNGEFDLVHVHKTLLEVYFSKLIPCPMVVTSHLPYLESLGKLSTDADKIRLKKYKNICYYTALSDFVKNQVDLNFVSTIYNGLDLKNYPFDQSGGDHLLFVGRMIERKGPDVAVKLADDLKKKLKLIGDIRPSKINRTYWTALESEIKRTSYCEYLGFINYKKMYQYYQKAKVLLFPIREPESFGMAIIEAMACGTPVIAFDLGPVSEIIENGKTGFICPPNDINAMANAVKKIYAMDEKEYQQMRKNCRSRVENKFTTYHMADGYEKVYHKVIEDYKKE